MIVRVALQTRTRASSALHSRASPPRSIWHPRRILRVTVADLHLPPFRVCVYTSCSPQFTHSSKKALVCVGRLLGSVSRLYL